MALKQWVPQHLFQCGDFGLFAVCRPPEQFNTLRARIFWGAVASTFILLVFDHEFWGQFGPLSCLNQVARGVEHSGADPNTEQQGQSAPQPGGAC